jgi:hypothetical protein
MRWNDRRNALCHRRSVAGDQEQSLTRDRLPYCSTCSKIDFKGSSGRARWALGEIPSVPEKDRALPFFRPPRAWDYWRDSARLFFDTAAHRPQGRISQALDVNPQGLSRTRIIGLFNRHVSKERIDLALEQRVSLGLLSRDTSSAGPGRPSAVWAKVSEGVDAGN